jgi:hypothetical protein
MSGARGIREIMSASYLAPGVYASFGALVVNPPALALYQAIWQTPPSICRRLRRPVPGSDPRRGLLSRSRHLCPLPLPQH